MKKTYQRDSRSLSILNWHWMHTYAIMDFFFLVIVYLCSIIWSMKSQRKCWSIAFLLFMCFLSVLISLLRPSWLWSRPFCFANKTHDEDLKLSGFFFSCNFRFFFFLSKCTRIWGFCKSYITEENHFAFLDKYATKTCF